LIAINPSLANSKLAKLGNKLHTPEKEEEEEKESKGPKEELMGSCLGQVFTINFIMKVYVKADAWNEFGEGDLV